MGEGPQLPTPPMTEATWNEPRHEVAPHDHALVVFEDDDDLLPPLSAFLEEGVQRDELIVFVHSFASEEEAWAFLERARGDAPKLRSSQVVLVSLYTDAFEGGAGRIDYEHVGRVVAGLEDTARERGRSAVRIFADASRRYFARTRVEEWFAFEEWLGRRLHARMGLVCAYQKADALRSDLFPQILRTHGYRFSTPGPTES